MTLIEKLEELSSFNLIKYTDHYVLTIDRGGGSPIIFQADSLDELEEKLLAARWF